MKLETYYDGYAWLTYDADNFDPTPDSSPVSKLLGVGNTKEKSIESWHEQKADLEE